MRRANVNYLAVGLFVIVTMTLLLIALYKVTGRVGNTEAYHVVYRNIVGLADGTLVTYEGYQIGYIDSVEPQQTESGTHYRVQLRVKKDWRIPSDSVARITASGLLAETVINIEEGDSSTYLEPGAGIPGAEGGDMFAVLGGVAEDIGTLTETTLRPLLENLNQHVGTLGQAMSAKVPPILDKVDRLAAELENSMRQINRIVDSETEQRVDTILTNSEQLSVNLLQLSGQLQQTGRQLDSLLGDAHSMVTDNDDPLRESVRTLQRTVTTIARAVDGILQDLETTGRNMNEFSRQLRTNPGVLLTGKPPADRDATP